MALFESSFSEQKFGSIGKLEKFKNGTHYSFATGFFISQYAYMTNAHAVFDTSIDGVASLNGMSAVMKLQYHNGAFTNSVSTSPSQVMDLRGYPESVADAPSGQPRPINRDMVLVETPKVDLDKASLRGLMAYSDYTELAGLNITSAGYPGALNNGQTLYSTSGYVGLAAPSGVFQAVGGFELQAGQSGSPVFTELNIDDVAPNLNIGKLDFISGVATGAGRVVADGPEYPQVQYFTPYEIYKIYERLYEKEKDVDVGELPPNYIKGSMGKDELKGTHRRDIIVGGDGDDIINGKTGSDLLFGNDGNDIIILGSVEKDKNNSSDYALGGKGSDIFVVGAQNVVIPFDSSEDRKEDRLALFTKMLLPRNGDGPKEDEDSDEVIFLGGGVVSNYGNTEKFNPTYQSFEFPSQYRFSDKIAFRVTYKVPEGQVPSELSEFVLVGDNTGVLLIEIEIYNPAVTDQAGSPELVDQFIIAIDNYTYGDFGIKFVDYQYGSDADYYQKMALVGEERKFLGDLDGAPEEDQISGMISGSAAEDILIGTSEHDLMIGRAGDDDLFGFDGDDELRGGDGEDYLDGGLGDDMLGGGTGADIFVYKAGYGNDIVSDFESGDIIYIDNTLASSFAQLMQKASQQGTDVQFLFQAGQTLTIRQAAVENLAASSFRP